LERGRGEDKKMKNPPACSRQACPPLVKGGFIKKNNITTMECIQIKKDGSKCSAQTMQNSVYCVFHNPDITDEERFRIRAEARKSQELALPEMKIERMRDVVAVLADSINNVRIGKIPQKAGGTIAYMSFVLMMAMEKADEQEKQEKIEKLKAEGKWHLEPEFERKHYIFKDHFYVDKDGNKFVVEREKGWNGGKFIPEDELEPASEPETNNSCKTKVRHAKKSIRKVNGKNYSESVLAKTGPLTEEDYNQMTNEILTTLKSNEIINST